MSKRIFLLAFLLISVLGCQRGNEDYLSVENVAKSPESYKGEMELSGVVLQAFPTDSSFVIISLEEYKRCGISCSSAPQIPVKYQGKTPRPRAEVWVKGRIIKTDKGQFLFLAKEVRVNEA